MKCPECGCVDSDVKDSRQFGDGIRRRRECVNCHTRYTTSEAVTTLSAKDIRRLKRMVKNLGLLLGKDGR